MTKIFLDTNILLDSILDREELAYSAQILLQLNSLPQYEVCASYLSFANIAYIIRKMDKEKRYQILRDYSNKVSVLPMDNGQLQSSLNLEAADFEDMLQYQCAIDANCDVLVTNNTKHFSEFCKLPLFTSLDFLLEI